MRPISRIVRYAWPIVLLLTVGPMTAFGQSFVCHAIRRGETATEVARRVTGSTRNTYQAWFQIRNASSRFVPKSQYNRIRAGWQACVSKAVAQSLLSKAQLVEGPDVLDASDESEPSKPSAVADALAMPVVLASAEAVAVAGDGPSSIASDVPRAIRLVDLTMMWLGAALIVPWFGWRIVDGYLVRRKTASIVMRHFARRFVDEFERPLIRYHDGEHPVRSRLRCNTRRGRLDILLAPGVGRRYPNLSDHKKNVEYDVSRVVDALADDSFVSGRLYTQSGWVVVPFQFKAGPKQPGVTCISSL